MILYEQHLATVGIQNPPPRGIVASRTKEGEHVCCILTYIDYIGFVTMMVIQQKLHSFYIDSK